VTFLAQFMGICQLCALFREHAVAIKVKDSEDCNAVPSNATFVVVCMGCGWYNLRHYV